MGACGETGGMYDWDMAIEPWGVAVWNASDGNVCDCVGESDRIQWSVVVRKREKTVI